jgi:hypothetical protein
MKAQQAVLEWRIHLVPECRDVCAQSQIATASVYVGWQPSNANALGVEHVGPVQPPVDVQLQVLGLEHVPPLEHDGLHTVWRHRTARMCEGAQPYGRGRYDITGSVFS